MRGVFESRCGALSSELSGDKFHATPGTKVRREGIIWDRLAKYFAGTSAFPFRALINLKEALVDSLLLLLFAAYICGLRTQSRGASGEQGPSGLTAAVNLPQVFDQDWYRARLGGGRNAVLMCGLLSDLRLGWLFKFAPSGSMVVGSGLFAIYSRRHHTPTQAGHMILQ
ncbi:hypothetical protein EDB89DRAFT_2124876 [Lactarius sanguifluus]|nr:hypothetical protein EDB89DRAFT_2124876 [Lactarius sanguifluus]